MPNTIMIVNDDAKQLEEMKQMVQQTLRCEVIMAHGGKQAIEYMLLRAEPRPCLILVSLMMSDVSGVEVIRSLRCSDKLMPVIAISSPSGIRSATFALQAGACDVLQLPLNTEQLRFSVQTLWQRMALHNEQDRLTRLQHGKVLFSDMIGTNEAYKLAVDQARRVADSSIPVLIEGGRGTGKEWLARAIHGNGLRSGEHFLTVNCQHQTDDALECLFQAFQQETPVMMDSGQIPIRTLGRGTLFLRHVEALSMRSQKLLLHSLRHLQSRHPLPVRIIASSPEPLAIVMREGFFRKDLYDELARYIITLPNLHERVGDIVPLAEHFTRRFSALEGRNVYGILPDCESMLIHHNWTENVRELAQVMHRAVLESDTSWIGIEQLSVAIASLSMVPAKPAYPLPMAHLDGPSMFEFLSREGHVRSMDDMEAELIRYAILYYKGKMTEVARRLGIGRSTLYRKIQDYHIDHPLEHAA